MSKARDIADLDFNAPDIDGGNIDGAVIGGTTAAAGTFLAINSGAHLINASSSAFGGSSVQGFNTDFLVDTGQGYARHNSYHTGGSNHQFLVNEAGSTTNAVALSIAKDKSATFSSTIAATGSANSTSSSHIPAVLGSGSYGGGIATRDGAESGWYQQSSGADWHFYHNRTVASQTPESKRVLSFTSTGDAKVYGHLFGDDDSSYFRINAGPGGGGAIYLNGANRTNYNNHIQYMADVHNFGDADGSPINTLQVVSDANLVTVNGALNVTGLTTSDELNTSKILIKDGSTTTGGVFHEKDITGAGTSTDTSLFAETGRDIHFMSQGSANIKASVDLFGITAGKEYGVNQTTNAFTGGNAASAYTAGTNVGYTQGTSYHAASNGEKLIGTANVRAYTRYAHFKTNLTANSQMFFFRVKGYFYGYGINEAVIGGYTHSNNSIINVSTQTVYRANSSFNLHVYRAPDGGLVLRLEVNQQGYTEGLALITFSNHSPSTTSSVVILDAIHRDDGNNAY